MSKNAKIYNCETCDFTCSKMCEYNRHLSTAKHKNVINDIQKTPKNAEEYICNCGKIYKNYSSLWRHKKCCNTQNIHNSSSNNSSNNSSSNNNSSNNSSNNNSSNNNISNDNIKNIVFEIIQQNQNNNNDLIQFLINENKEFKNLILELSKKDTICNTNNNINSHNKTFNLQLFLNETCKDAMNMSEFIDSVKLQLSDLESVGKLGFIDGISNIIIKNLEALDIDKRPVHCSDSKRETMYIKDHDKWEKDDSEMRQMKGLVRIVRDKNISMINTWRDLYPECVKSNSKKTAQFNQICMEAFGGETGGEKGTKQEKEEKIISKIAKSVIINKSE